MLESPYLSDETMIEAINNTSVLTDYLLKLILVANPQCTRSDAVMNALEERVPPLHQNMITVMFLFQMIKLFLWQHFYNLFENRLTD